MKLRNKKTGEIKTAYVQVIVENNHPAKPLKYDTQLSLAELNEEWEDYEEPKGYWFINSLGEIICPYNPRLLPKGSKEIGNYFETKEEAEQAVEKLKAWKRLEDAGVRFELARIANDETATIFARFPNREKFEEINGELFKIFGGEE